MTTKKRIRENQTPLIVEAHPDDYTGYPFITLIQYCNQHILAIVDNASEKNIKAYVLDLCGPADIDEELVIRIAVEWFQTKKTQYPLSFEFSQLGISGDMSKIYRTFNTDFVTRIIGPLPNFEMKSVQSVKRRRRKPVPEGIEIKKLDT